MGKKTQERIPQLRLISNGNVFIHACKGGKRAAIYYNGDIFRGGVYGDIRGLRHRQKSTPIITVDVYEFTGGISLNEALELLSVRPEDILLTQAQIVEFAKTNRGYLAKTEEYEGNRTFLLFKEEVSSFSCSERIFVSKIFISNLSAPISIGVDPLKRIEEKKYGRFRIIIPK